MKAPRRPLWPRSRNTEPLAERSSGRLTLLRLSVGKEESVRPADLVGAIAGEAGVPSRVIGAIKIHDDYSLVEVPEELSDRIIEALQQHEDPRPPVTVQAKPCVIGGQRSRLIDYCEAVTARSIRAARSPRRARSSA